MLFSTILHYINNDIYVNYSHYFNMISCTMYRQSEIKKNGIQNRK